MNVTSIWMDFRVKNSNPSPPGKETVSQRHSRNSRTQMPDRNCTWGSAGFPAESTGLGVLSQTQLPDCASGDSSHLSRSPPFSHMCWVSLHSLRSGIWGGWRLSDWRGMPSDLIPSYFYTVLFTSRWLYWLLKYANTPNRLVNRPARGPQRSSRLAGSVKDVIRRAWGEPDLIR